MTDSGNGQPNTEKSSNYPVGAQKASEVYSKSWQYTLYNLAIPTIYGTIGGVAGGVVGGSVGGAVGSIAGPAGTTLGATWGAKIFASMGAGAASKLASTLDKEGVGKELEQNIFIYKALGHKDLRTKLGEKGSEWVGKESLKYQENNPTYSNEASRLLANKWNSWTGVREGELNSFQKGWNSVLDNFKEDNVFDELKDLVKIRVAEVSGEEEPVSKEEELVSKEVKPEDLERLESLIGLELSDWVTGDKNFINGLIDKINNNLTNPDNPDNSNNLKGIELLSELYANLKLRLYDRSWSSGAQEVGLAAVTGAAVGGVGGAVGMIPINNVFADRAVITGARASTSGTMSWLLGEKMSWSQWFQTFAVSEVGAESGAVLGMAANNALNQYQLNEYRQDVTKEFDKLSLEEQHLVLNRADITIGGTDPGHHISLSSVAQDKLKELKLCIAEYNVQSAADHLLISKPEQHASSGGTNEDPSRTDFDDQAPRRRLGNGLLNGLNALHNNVMDGHVPPNITATLKNIALHIKTHDEACKLLDTILATHNGEARVAHSESNNQTHIDYCADPDKAAVILDYIASSEELSKLVESDKGLHHSFHKVYNNIISYNTHNGPNKDISLNHNVRTIYNVTDDAPTEGHKVDTKQLADLRALANVIQKHGDSDKQYWTLEGSDVFREQRAIERLKLGVSEMDGEPIKWGVLQTVVYDGILSPKELQNIIDSKDGWNALEKIESNHHMSDLFSQFVGDNGQLNDGVNKDHYLDAVDAYIGKLDENDSYEWKEIFGQLGGVGDLSEEKKAMYLDTLKSSVEDGKLTPDILKDIIGGDNGWKDLKEIAGDDNLCKIFNSLLDNNQLNDDMINKYMDHLGHNIQDQAQFDFFKKLRGDEGITLTEVTREGIGQMVHQYEGNHLFDNMQDYLTHLSVPERFIGVVAAALAAACCIGKAASAAVSGDRIPNPSPEDATIEDNIPFFYIRREGTDSTIDTSQITAVGKERIFIMQQDRGSKDAGDYLSQEGNKEYFAAQKNSYVYARGVQSKSGSVLQKEVNIVRHNDMNCLLINDNRLTNASIKIDFTDKGPKLSLVERGNNGARIAICGIQPKDGGDIDAILNSITINVHDIERSTNMKFEKIATELKWKDRGEVEGDAMESKDVQKNIESTYEAIKKAMKNVKKDLIQVRE